jgi:nucleotidyltransferase substrate binding protein (TIGR01987 family)
MESRLIYKLAQLRDALDNFEASLSIDIEALDETIVDSIKSGRVQKFEVCTELIWKTLKVYLLETNGIEAQSPKSVIKEFYNIGSLTLEDYEQLMDAVDDRNRVSHVYNQDQFEEIYRRAVQRLPLFRHVLTQMMES